MDLTAATLAELVRALRSHGTAMDKRKTPRVGLTARIQVTFPTISAPVVVRVRDVSAGGMNILCDHELKKGDTLTVELGPLDRPQCMVRHCRKLTSGLFGVGVQFLDYDPRHKPVPQQSAAAAPVIKERSVTPPSRVAPAPHAPAA